MAIRNIKIVHRKHNIKLNRTGKRGLPGVGLVEQIIGGNNIVVDSTDQNFPVVKTDFKLHIGDTPPTNPAMYDLWVDTSV